MVVVKMRVVFVVVMEGVLMREVRIFIIFCARDDVFERSGLRRGSERRRHRQSLQGLFPRRKDVQFGRVNDRHQAW